MRFRRDAFGILLLLQMLSLSGLSDGREPAPTLRVMSFNIRYGTAADGPNHWDRRKDFLTETIQAFDPDFLGTQETLAFQRDFIVQKLPDYDHFGVGRDDGKQGGEMSALFYKKDRFEKLNGGHFWLSETPEKAGSKSWDSSLPRMVTWVKLRDLRSEKTPPIAFFNTHFDHRGTTARLESARLLRRQIDALAKDCAVVVTGDFNTGESSPPYQALFNSVDGQPSPLVDSYRQNNPDKRPDEGTFSSFKVESNKGDRIDWIGVSRDWQIRSAAIDHTSRDGATPSDHFPVTAVLRHASELNKPVSKQEVISHGGLTIAGRSFEVESIQNIPYYNGQGMDRRKHKLDLYLPKGGKDFPVLLFVHGGAWSTGDRWMYELIGRTLARKGIGTVVNSYRLSPGVQHPTHIEDVARAFAWTHKNIAQYGGRADRIFVSGHSAGGHLAALLATDEKYLKAHGLSIRDIHGAIPISGVYVFKAGLLQERVIGKGRDAALNASPMTHITGDEPPFLILFAQNDFPTCGGMSRNLSDALKAKGVEAECREVPHRDHITIMVFAMFNDHDVLTQAILKFIADHSK